MLVIKATMMEGRTAGQKEALIRRLSEVAAEELGWPLEDIRVVIYEVTKQDWGIAGSSVLETERETK